MKKAWCVPLFLLSAGPLVAQQVTGSISGVVADASRSVIAGAAVKLYSQTTAAVRETVTDSEGKFVFNAVAAGIYKISVACSGFKGYEQSDIELTPNQSLSLGEIKLEVGAVTESVTVVASGAAVQTTSGERSGILASDEIENLTVLNRDFTTLVSLLPGVVENLTDFDVPGFSGYASFHVGGNRSNANSITIDGGSVENSNGGNPNNFVSIDSLQAVRIVTSNYQAEFGRKPGAGIMAITKGGGQRFRGAAYWNYRHEWMNANRFFNNMRGLSKTPQRVTIPGFNIGGPVFIPGKFNTQRRKLFFFASLEFIRERRPQDPRYLTVPTDAEINGDFSRSVTNSGAPFRVNDPLNNKTAFPGGIIPASRINRAGQNYLKLLPRPNVFDVAITRYAYNYQTQESMRIPKVSHSHRIDYVINDKTTLWFKYNYWREDQQGWAVAAGNSNWGWMPSHYLNKSHAPVLSLTRIVNPKTIFELALRVTRWTEDGSALYESDYQRLNRKAAGVDIPQFWPANNPRNLVPNFQFGGSISNAPNTSLNERFPLRGAETPLYSDATLTYTHGSHISKFGFYYERWLAVKGEAGNWNGTFSFSVDSSNPNDSNNSFANALLGNFRSYTESNTRPPLYETTNSIEWFVQDNWKLTRRFTLDLGVRFGWSQPWHSPRRQEAGFVPSLWDPSRAVQLMIPVRVNNQRRAQDPITGELYPATVIGAIAPATGDPYNGTVNLLTDPNYPHGLRRNTGIKTAPRFGFAWDPFGDGRTALRGGFGVFYEIHEKDIWSYALHRNPPNQLTPQIFYGDLNTFISSTGFLFPSNTRGIDAGRALARTMSYSFGIQRQLPARLLIDAAYVATLGRHLFARSNMNSIPQGTTLQPWAQDPSNPGNPLASQYLRRYMGYGEIYYYTYDTNSSYHSLQLQVNRRMTRDVSGGLSYTWSKAMDYVDNDTTDLSTLVSPKVRNYGLAGFDRTHILKGNWIWNLPRGSRLLPRRGMALQAGKFLLDGWQVSGILTLVSGAPMGVSLSLTSGNANNWSGSPTDAARPDHIANANLEKSQKTFYRALNTEAFALPPQGTLGNAAKYVFRGPGRNNWDVSLFKTFRATERVRAQFRFESYNMANHPQFSAVDTAARFDVRTGNLTPTTFGQYTNAYLPRRMQAALRITF